MSANLLAFPIDRREKHVILASLARKGVAASSLPFVAKPRISLMVPVPTNAGVSPAAESGSRNNKARMSEAPSPDVLAPEVLADDNQRLLQEYSRLRDRFLQTTNALASAAHDLKTPLAILNGYVELLRSEKVGELNDRQRQILGDMQANGARLLNFIQDFLTYSSLEAGELQLHYESGDMNLCLSEICRLWSQRFQDRGQALYFLGNDKLVEFPFDYAKVQRVVSNLLENASKYTPAGGTIWLHAEPHMWDRRAASQPGVVERRRQNSPAANSVKVSVADTGPGISPEYQIEIFDDFFRLPQTATHADGMGLGLAIARRLITTMGGKIWVESEPGAGSKFSFVIPLKPVPKPAGKGKRG